MTMNRNASANEEFFAGDGLGNTFPHINHSNTRISMHKQYIKANLTEWRQVTTPLAPV